MKQSKRQPPTPSHRRFLGRIRTAHVGIILVAGGVAIGGALLLKRGAGSSSGEAGAFVTADDGEFVPQRPEFEQLAQKVFQKPGGILSRAEVPRLLKELQAAGKDPNRRAPLLLALTEAQLKAGEPAKAIQAWEDAMALIGDNQELLRQNPDVLRVGAVAQLRQAEVNNCVRRHNRDCCVFPLKDGGLHVEASPVEKAAKLYEQYLALRPTDLAAQFLLNITHMAQGTHPEGVPEPYRIQAEGPGIVGTIPRFRDVAMMSGITRLNNAGGAVADDIDGDGLIDLVLSDCNPIAPLTYYRNLGDGKFEDLSAKSRLDDQFGGLNLVSTDYDNDGDVDLFVLRGAWMFAEGQIRRSLLRQNDDGTFTDVTRASGLADPASPTQCGVWFDYDNDGDLDLFVGNESLEDKTMFPEVDPKEPGIYPSQLFRNNGDGTFVDVAKEAGVTNNRYAKGASAGDYDNDGDLDLYVSNIGRNRLYKNNGNGTFTDVAEELALVEPVKRSFATWFFDFDNDGNLDIFVGAYDIDRNAIPAWYMGKPFEGAPPRLYRNKGDGTFEDVTKVAGLWRPMQPMGANFGDLDNDGWLDMYLTTGNPDYEALMPNVMFRNTGKLGFEDVTTAGGFGNLQKGHGCAFADFDNDGDQDVFNELGAFWQGDTFYNTLYENPGNQNHSVTLDLAGTKSNRLAYGARIKVVARGKDGERVLHRAVGSVSSFGGSPARQEIGLGDATEIVSVEIWWPVTGERQRFEGLAIDSFYEITEGDPVPRRVTPPTFRFGSTG